MDILGRAAAVFAGVVSLWFSAHVGRDVLYASGMDPVSQIGGAVLLLGFGVIAFLDGIRISIIGWRRWWRE